MERMVNGIGLPRYRPDAPTCLLCYGTMQYFGTFSDEEMDAFDPDRTTIMLRYLCFTCHSSTEINCGTDTVQSEPESQEEKDAMVIRRVVAVAEDLAGSALEED